MSKDLQTTEIGWYYEAVTEVDQVGHYQHCTLQSDVSHVAVGLAQNLKEQQQEFLQKQTLHTGICAQFSKVYRVTSLTVT